MTITLFTRAAAVALGIAALFALSPAQAQSTSTTPQTSNQPVPDGFGHMIVPSTGTAVPGAPTEGTAAKKGSASAQATGHGEGPEPKAQAASHDGEGPAPKVQN